MSPHPPAEHILEGLSVMALEIARSQTARTSAALFARICLSAVYLYSAVGKLLDPPGGLAEVTGLGLPAPRLFLVLTILVQLGAGWMVLLGFWTRLAAFLLLGFTIIATALAHNPTGLIGTEFQHQLTTSLEHLAIVGGFILIIADGAGPASIDGWIARRANRRTMRCTLQL